MKRIRSPITIFGGKGRLVSRMLPLFPPHRIFADVCGGAASVLLAKPPCEVDVYNDVDSGLVNLFRVIRDPALVSELRQRLECTPFSREEFEHCRNTGASSRSRREGATLLRHLPAVVRRASS